MKSLGAFYFAQRGKTRSCPPALLADILNEKIERLESMESRPIRAKEKQRLKEDALAELLPRALPKSKQIFGYISTTDDLLVVDTASSPEAEMFLNCLRATLGSLKVVPPQVKTKPTDSYHALVTVRQTTGQFFTGGSV